jgi:hypothetical protein
LSGEIGVNGISRRDDVEGKVDTLVSNVATIDSNVDILVQRAQCDVGMAASTTAIVCAQLAGYGEDYFNVGWKMCILQNVNSAGNAPENEWREITNYVTATGTFTTTAFSANVQESDYIMVARDEFAKLARYQHVTTYFSDTDDSITCKTDSSDLTLPSVVLPNITGTIVSAFAGIKFRIIENTNGAGNGLNGAQDIQVKESAAGAYMDAINLVDNQWLLPASTREGGDVVVGDIDVVAQVAAFNKTYNFIIDNNDVDQADLNLIDVQTFLIVYWY